VSINTLLNKEFPDFIYSLSYSLVKRNQKNFEKEIQKSIKGLFVFQDIVSMWLFTTTTCVLAP